MIVKEFNNLKLSALGLGAMRLPVIDGDDSKIDEAATSKMVDYAIGHGVTYFDTAWGYHGGNSEIVLGKILLKYPRKSFYLADKFPGYDLSTFDKTPAIFEEQLKKCGVGYFDFYLLHNVCEMNIDAYLDGQHGIVEYLLKQKEAGRIRNLGFSAHGGLDVMKRFLDVHREKMEFCMIQLNYLDWTFQSAKEKVELLNERHIPIWAMEPMRGGRLSSLSCDNAAELKALRPEEDIPAWALRFLESIPGVTMILSGMSNMQQLQDNIRTFETEQPLNEQELDKLLEIADGMTKKIAIPCTACNYCVSHCPQRLNIPALIDLYNEHCFTADGGLFAFIAPMALMALPEAQRPAACVGCGACEAVCPQNIKIAKVMTDFAEKLG